MNDQLTAELILAQLGIADILRGTAKVHGYHHEAAANLPRVVRRRLSRFLRTASFTADSDGPDFDYRQVLKLLDEQQDPQPAADNLFATVGDPDLAADIGIDATKVTNYLRQIMPKSVTPTIAGGARIGDPPAAALATFRRIYAVAENPMIVLDELEAGSLSPDVVSALALMYPNVYQIIVAAAQDELASATAARGEDWEPVYAKRRLLKMLIMQETTDAPLLAAVNAARDTGAPRAPKASGKTKASASAEPDDNMTPGQRAAAGTT